MVWITNKAEIVPDPVGLFCYLAWVSVQDTSSERASTTEGFSQKYTVLERLAVGGMAELFLAELEGLHGFRKKVVIKKMLPQYATDENYIEMFLDEARLVAQLNHASIVQVFDIGQGTDGVFFTMEYVDGFTVSNILRLCTKRKRQLELSEVLAIAIPVAEALEHAHAFCDEDGTAMELVHRDVSPSNVIVTTKGRVKLLDFGVAKSKSQLSLTVGNSIKGKFGYMAPEQCRGDELDKRCDVFSFGVVFWEMLTGKRLFPGGVERAVLQKILEEDAPAPSTECESLPPAIDAICAKALARNRDERYADMREFLDDVAEFERSIGSTRTSRTLCNLIETLYPNGRVASPLTSEESVRLSAPLVSTGVGSAPNVLSADLTAPTSAIHSRISESTEGGPRGSSRSLFIVGGIAATAVVLLLFVLLRGGDSKGEASATAGAGDAGLTAGKPVGAAPAAPEAESGEFLVEMKVTPAIATIEIDGEQVGVGKVAKKFSEDGGTHRYRIAAEGYVSVEGTFVDEAPAAAIALQVRAAAAEDEVEPKEEERTRRRNRRRRSSSAKDGDPSREAATITANPERPAGKDPVKPERPVLDVGGGSDNLDPWAD